MNPWFWNTVFFLVFISLIALLVWLHVMQKETKSDGKEFNLKKITSHDSEIMNYFVTYLIPILSLEITSLSSILMNLIFIFSVGVFFVRNNTLHYNILLILLGYHVYSDELNNIIISRKKLHEITNKALKADQMGTSNIYYI